MTVAERDLFGGERRPEFGSSGDGVDQTARPTRHGYPAPPPTPEAAGVLDQFVLAFGNRIGPVKRQLERQVPTDCH